MATYARTLRRGLPRIPGGDPWPPAGETPGGAAAERGSFRRVPLSALLPEGNWNLSAR